MQKRPDNLENLHCVAIAHSIGYLKQVCFCKSASNDSLYLLQVSKYTSWGKPRKIGLLLLNFQVICVCVFLCLYEYVFTRMTQSHADTYENTHAHTHTRTHAHMHTRTHAHTNTQTHRHTNTQTHKHTNTQTHKHTNTQTHKHTNTHAQTHKHTHMYKHTHV